MRSKMLLILALTCGLALIASSAFSRPPECYEYCPCVGNDIAVCWDYGLSTCNEFCGTGFSSTAQGDVLFEWDPLTFIAAEEVVQKTQSSVASPATDGAPGKK